MDTLKPCPFCGGKAKITNGDTVRRHQRVECTICRNCTAEYLHPSEYPSAQENMIKRWNQRHQLNATPQPGADVSGLVEAAQAVIDRWDTTLWKNVPHTAGYINTLRQALAAYRAQDGVE